MISLLQFPCTSMSTPPKVFTVFKHMVNDFIWNGKRNKIAYNVIIQDIDNGGLKLPDLKTRIQVIHLNWVKYMWKEQQFLLSETLRAAFRYPDVRSLLVCKSDLSSKVDPQHKLLTEILSTWSELQANYTETESAIQEQPLWFNDCVTINKKIICWRSWLEAGIFSVNDLLHLELPRFLSHEELSLKYNLNIPFLQVFQIRSSLPSKWRRLLVNPAGNNLSIKLQIVASDESLMDISQASSKRLYKIIITRKKQKISSQRKWNLEFPPPAGISIADYWESKYRSAFRSVRETKLQSFQFKLLHRIIPCSKYLKTIRVKDDDKCPACGEVDSLSHFFYFCPLVQLIWNSICNWFAGQVNILLANTDVGEVILGVPRENPQARVLNYIILSFKFYIFRQRLYYDSRFELTAFLREFRNKLKIEEYICSCEGKADRFNIWRNILSALG